MSNKKKVIIVSTVCMAIIIIALSVCLSLFLPRKVSNIISTDNIVSVEVTNYGQRVELKVSDEEFISDLTNSKYNCRYSSVKAESSYEININYPDKSVTINGWMIKVNDITGSNLITKNIVLLFDVETYFM